MSNTAKELDLDEMEVCLRRGHKTSALGMMADGKWGQCEWCGLWLRAVTTIEESVDVPPMDERNMVERLRGPSKS
jgi:hypothetical protein